MKPFFDTPEKIDALEAEARTWVDTPFVPHAMVKQAGADCVHLVAGIYLACGALKKLKTERYALDEGNHLKASKVSNWFANRQDFQRVENLKPGDALVFNLAIVGHHVGLMLTGDEFIHAFPGRRVQISYLRESFYASRIVEIQRPMEVAS